MSVIGKASVFAAVLVGFGVGTAHAQETITANVPFPFVAGHVECAAGRYEIHAIDYVSNVIVIESSTDPSCTAFLQTNALYGRDAAGDQPSLEFTRRENQYRLERIWDSATEGRELVGVGRERREARSDSRQDLTCVVAANWR